MNLLKRLAILVRKYLYYRTVLFSTHGPAKAFMKALWHAGLLR